MQQPLISVLIPFKNTENYLTDCLESVIIQTYKNWEVIIVDDGSTDSSYALVELYALKDNRIKLYKNTGNGIIDALQLAFKHSKGHYISRMDSDDIMHPHKLDTLITNLKTYGTHHVAVGLVSYFSDESIQEGYENYEIWLNGLTKTGQNYSEIYKECVIPSPCWMIHRDDLLACDAFNPTIYPEDYDLAFRFYKYGIKCIPCNKILHYWRDYDTRTSRTHIHYAQNHFTSLKIHYFLDIDYNKNKTLTIWGAGTKGKIIAQTLLEKNIPFEWICDNPKKIGRDIYGKELKAFNALQTIVNPQSIITVANKKAQVEIRNYLDTLKMKPSEDYVFFC
jgi:glycosyltransferase involved in cell wall biosynthesis